MAGPIDGEDGAANPFPRGSAVRSVNLRDGQVTVDFDERLQNVGGSCAALMIRESVTKTLLELPAVKKVVITSGGSEALALQP
jgi:spore germination protein GerM